MGESGLAYDKIGVGNPALLCQNSNNKRGLTMPRRAKGHESPNVNTKWFIDRIRDRGFSQAGLAKAIGMDRSQLNKTLYGKRNPDNDEMVEMAKWLACTHDEIALHFGKKVPSDSAKRVGRLRFKAAGTGRLTKIPGDHKTPRPAPLPDNAEAVEIMFGWIAWYAPVPRIEPEAVSRAAVVTLDDGSRYVGFPKRQGGGLWSLTSLCQEDAMDGLRIVTANPVLLIQP